MKLLCWNVNGIRSVLKKGFLDVIAHHSPDVLCLQETKAHPNQVDKILEGFEHHFWNSAVKKGYSGTAVFSKVKPLSVKYGIGVEKHDQEGRVIVLEFDDFFLVNVYVPNAGPRTLARLDYRTKEWDVDFLKFLRGLEKSKSVLVCGDFNVAHEEIDLARPKENRNKSAGFTDVERNGFSEVIKHGFVDLWRSFHPQKQEFTWWSYMFNARAKNVGWRIDYWLCSKKFESRVKDCKILGNVVGSDHCPVELVLK